MKEDNHTIHLRILRDAQAITSRYLELGNKTKVAKEFGIAASSVDTALFHTGHRDLCSKYFLRWKKIREPEAIGPEPLPPKEEKPISPSQEGLQARAVAAELLTRVIEAINQYDKVFSEARFWKSQADELEARLKKVAEERDRAIRVHNEMVKQSSNGKLPTIEEVVKVLRREHTLGKPL